MATFFKILKLSVLLNIRGVYGKEPGPGKETADKIILHGHQGRRAPCRHRGTNRYLDEKRGAEKGSGTQGGKTSGCHKPRRKTAESQTIPGQELWFATEELALKGEYAGPEQRAGLNGRNIGYIQGKSSGRKMDEADCG